MSQAAHLLSSIKGKLRRFPLFRRVLIGNSLVIILGAIGGTLITRQLTIIGDWGLILFFSTLGILLTLLVNYIIIKTALQPLADVRNMVEQVQTKHPSIPRALMKDTDPDILRLVEAIDGMVRRLNRRTRQLRALSERAISAQEEERKRIARGLHDDTSQALASLIISLERLENALPMEPAELEFRLAEARGLASRTLDDLRKITLDLRPTILDDLGLIPAMRWYARFRLGEAEIDVFFDLPDENLRFSPHLETLLFRIAQEAVTNILHHADAESVTIRLRQENACICLQVEDDGQGFDVVETTGMAVFQKRLGLLGIQERVALVSGEVRIDSEPGRGTCLHVCVPCLEEGNGRA